MHRGRLIRGPAQRNGLGERKAGTILKPQRGETFQEKRSEGGGREGAMTEQEWGTGEGRGG